MDLSQRIHKHNATLVTPSSKRHQITTKTRHNHYEELDQSPNTNLNKIKGQIARKKEGESHYHPVALSKHDQDKEKLPKIDKISKAEFFSPFESENHTSKLEDPYMSEEDLEKDKERKIWFCTQLCVVVGLLRQNFESRIPKLPLLQRVSISSCKGDTWRRNGRLLLFLIIR